MKNGKKQDIKILMKIKNDDYKYKMNGLALKLTHFLFIFN